MARVGDCHGNRCSCSSSKQVIFCGQPSATSTCLPSDRGIDVTLSVGRPGVLDHDMPKCLLPLGSTAAGPMDQLVAGGIHGSSSCLAQMASAFETPCSALPVAQHCAINSSTSDPYARGFAQASSLRALCSVLGAVLALHARSHLRRSLVSGCVLHYLGALTPSLLSRNATSISGALPPTAVHVSLAAASAAAVQLARGHGVT